MFMHAKRELRQPAPNIRDTQMGGTSETVKMVEWLLGLVG